MRRILAKLSLVVLLLTLSALALGNYLMLRPIFWPERIVKATGVDLLMRAEDVSFRTVDGVELSGNFIAGKRGNPAIVFCHDRGQSRAAVLPVALLHSRLGFNILVFDFRAHGRSQGDRSTLGIREREDVVAAVRYLETRADIDPSSIGIWGEGMGAAAALFAATELPKLRVISLNFLAPDLTRPIRTRFREVFHARLGGVLEELYLKLAARLVGSDLTVYHLDEAIKDLTDRQFLFAVSDEQPEAAEFVIDKMYANLDPFHRTLIRVHRAHVPAEGSDREAFELNTVQFFKGSMLGPKVP